MFRPCIDLHDGKVKQIVGSSLADGAAPVTNFETDRPPAWFARLFRDDALYGGHVIMLGPGNEAAAREALKVFPGGLQIGGGINPLNAPDWLEAGANHVIVTSYVFRDGQIDWSRLEEMSFITGKNNLVLDLSCRLVDGQYLIVTDRWQKLTKVPISAETLKKLSHYCAEFLVHAADVEGKQQGVDLDLVRLLGEVSPIPTTYAGGARELDDMNRVHEAGQARIELTIGSALDIYGGALSYKEAVLLSKSLPMKCEGNRKQRRAKKTRH